MNKSFYVCRGYEINHITKKKIIFFHTPKCAGTTFANILSHMINKSYRINGPLTSFSGFKNPKPQMTSEENFNLEKDKIKILNPNFIFGHFSINLKYFFNDAISIAMLREPISRSISHFNFQIQRKTFDLKKNISECYDSGFLLDNIITRQFSGQLTKKKLEEDDYIIALNNLKKIDLLFKTESVRESINYLISIYDLPNVIYQSQQITSSDYFEKNNKNLQILYDKNSFDLKLYENLINNDNFFTEQLETKSRIMNKTFFWAQNDKYYNNRKEILDEDQIKLIYEKLNL